MNRYSPVLLALAAFLPSQSLTWIPNPATGNEYALTTPMSWMAAQALGDSVGAHLCVIDDADENTWVADHFLAILPLYIGGTDTFAEGLWTTPYGWPLGYSNWSHGTVVQPDNSQGNEDRLQMWDANALFGVLRGTWNDCDGLAANYAVLERPIPRLIQFGSGCPGSNGTPHLHQATGAPSPAPGSLLQLQIDGMPVAGLALNFVGFDAIDLPLDILGMPGCSAYVDITTAWTVLAASGGSTAAWQTSLPNLPAIRGLHFFVQTLVFDPAAGNDFGATTSNGVEVHVGY